MKRRACLVIVSALFTSALFAGQPSADERTVWSLEGTYWRYVQTNDLDHYRITDWITAHTSNGESLKSYDLERLAAQATSNYVTVAHRARMTWIGRDGAERSSTIRVVHTRLREPGGKWQIVSGMAASPNAQGH